MIDLNKLTANDQIQVMRKLRQQAASWLADLSARTLRDHATIPRDAEGCYSAHDVISWSRSRTKPVSLDDGEINQSLNAAECLVDLFDEGNPGGLVALADFLTGLRDRHGDAGLGLFAVEMAKVFKVRANELRTDERTPAQVEADIRQRIERESLAYQVKQGQQALERVSVCADCGRWRKGSSWVGGSPPEGADTIESGCLDCLQ